MTRIRQNMYRITHFYLAASLLSLTLSCQSGFIYHPDPVLVADPGSIKLPFQSVYFRTADNITLHGWWIPSEKERGVALFCHGNAGNISHRLKTIETLNALGLSTFIFDYRGFGLSEGIPSESGTYADAEAAWNHLVEAKNISPDRIIVHGRSLGGAVAAWLAAKHNPAMLIVESSFTSTRDVARHHLGIPLLHRIITYRYDTLTRMGRISCPTLIVHAKEDEVIPYSQGKALYAAANEPKIFLEISGSHNYGFIQSHDRYFSGLDSFISHHLNTGSRHK